jgi:hypothetical protein
MGLPNVSHWWMLNCEYLATSWGDSGWLIVNNMDIIVDTWTPSHGWWLFLKFCNVKARKQESMSVSLEHPMALKRSSWWSWRSRTWSQSVSDFQREGCLSISAGRGALSCDTIEVPLAHLNPRGIPEVLFHYRHHEVSYNQSRHAVSRQNHVMNVSTN